MNVGKSVIAGLALIAATQVRAAYMPPQVQALRSLQAASTTSVRAHFRNGFPASVAFRVNRQAPGGDPVAAARNVLTEFAPLFGLDRPEIALTHARTDDGLGGTKAVRFAQTFRGVPVVDAEIVVYLRLQGFTATIEGAAGMLMLAATTDRNPPEPLDLDLVPAITDAMAVSAARTALGLPPGSETSGETALQIDDPRIVGNEGDPRLVWRVTFIRADSRQVLVDANTSEVLAKIDLMHTSDGLDDFDFQLDDALGGNAGISCYWFSETDSIGDEGEIDSDYFNDVDAVTAWWAARDAYLVLHDRFGRHSYDDDDGQLETWIRAVFEAPPDGPGNPNATGSSWCGIQFSSGFVSTDVLAHEFGHMVIDETSNLDSRNQQGALNESFADIIGHLSDPLDWLIGEAMTLWPGPIRNMKNPELLGDPNRYSQYMSLSPTVDNGGVHRNANIVNKAFYLMVAGGTFNGRPVEPMTLDQAGVLAYSAWTSLSAYAVFHDARNRAVDVAQGFADQGQYGFTEADVCTVRNAFRAVEIGGGDLDCNGVEDNPLDEDDDGVLNDGDESGSGADRPCHPISSWFSFETWHCDDNCPSIPNPTQKDFDGDGTGDLCEVDADNDGLPNSIDPCLGVPNDTQNYDGDGTINCLDPDDDNDGILDDGDHSGVEHDHPCPSNVTTNCDDNCKNDPNATQFDGNHNGYGDACDPDLDGDGFYVLDDNCTFVSNPGQDDTDGDGLGDACDRCSATPDNANAYHPGYPELGVDPFPLQPDSDGDGTPDACDQFGFAQFKVLNQQQPYSRFRAIVPDGLTRRIDVIGPAGAGGRVRLVLPVCQTSSPLQPNQRVDLSLSGLPATLLSGWVEDDSGRPVARISQANNPPNRRGMRFRPRCDRTYALMLRTEPGYTGSAIFFAKASVVTPAAGSANPYASNAGQHITPPPRPADQDADGFPDAIDTCPAVFDPDGADRDGDLVGDVCDNCPGVPNPGQQPAAVAFPTVLPAGAEAFGWPDDRDYNWISGPLAGLHSGMPFAVLGPGGTGSGRTFSLDRADPHCAGTSCWFLWKHAPAVCGTWGSPARDAALPTFCTVYGDCLPGESCIGGQCVAPLDGATAVLEAPAGRDGAEARE